MSNMDALNTIAAFVLSYITSHIILLTSIILSYPSEKHIEMRSKLATGYAGKDSPSFKSSMNNCITSLLDLIKAKYISKDSNTYRPLDWATMASNLTLDVITELGFSHCTGNINQDRDVFDYYGIIAQGLPVTQALTVFPWIVDWLEKSPAAKWLVPCEMEGNAFFRLLGFAKARARERFGPKRLEKQDMLGSFIRHGITQKEAESETIVQLMAGTDPAATALRATILYITTNPRVLHTLLTELRQHNLLPAPAATDSIISHSTAKNLPYLQSCIKESLRLCPPFNGVLEKVVPEGGDTLPDGRYVPAGTCIGLGFWGMMRDKAVFGADADMFRPERWLERVAVGEAEEERRRLMQRTVDCVFSAGRFTCMGKELALMQVGKVVVELLRRFEMEIVDPVEPWEIQAYGIFMQRNMWMRVTERTE